MERGGDVEQREQHPPGDQVGAGAVADGDQDEEQIPEHVHEGPEYGLEQHHADREPDRQVRGGSPHDPLALGHGLQDAAGPAVALLHQLGELLRHLRVGDGSRGVLDPVAGREQLQREIRVLREGVGVVAADLAQNVTPEDSDRARNDVDGAHEALGATRHVQALDVLERLQSGPHLLPVFDLHVAGDGGHPGIVEVSHGTTQRLRVQRRVAVHAEHVGVAGEADPGVQGRGLAGVRLADHAYVRRTVPTLEDGGLLQGVVRAAVVYDQNLEPRIVEPQNGADRLLDHRPLVVGGDDDAHRRQHAQPIAVALAGVGHVLHVLEVGQPEQNDVAQHQHAEEDDQQDHRPADHNVLHLGRRLQRPEDARDAGGQYADDDDGRGEKRGVAWLLHGRQPGCEAKRRRMAPAR